MVPHPDLARSQGPGEHEVLPAEEVLSVRRPGRRGHVPLRFLGDLTGVTPVARDGPDVVDAIPVAHERDPGPVRRESRLEIVGSATGDPGRAAPVDGHRVQVAHQVEHDGPSVGAHVEIDPGPLRHREGDLFGGAPGVLHRPVGGLLGEGAHGSGDSHGDRERDRQSDLHAVPSSGVSPLPAIVPSGGHSGKAGRDQRVFAFLLVR
jgi:hypothetical protein